jgi:hypothetical protein
MNSVTVDCMKAVDVDFKKADVVDYYSQLDQVKVRILFSDGKEKALVKQFSITDPGKQAAELLSEIKAKLKEQHREFSLDDHPLAGALVLRVKQDQEVLYERLAKFLASVRERIRSGKLAKLSYFDLEKKIVGASTKFD